MRTIVASLSALAALSFPACAQEHGQGPVGEGPIHIDDLNLGAHWFGSKVETKQLRGKVVLVEMWGS